jgi:predicted aconitase
MKKYAEDLGYANILESLGIRLVSNTCPATMPHNFFKKHGYRAVATDSPKLVYYISNTKDMPCYYGSLENILHAVTNEM